MADMADRTAETEDRVLALRMPAPLPHGIDRARDCFVCGNPIHALRLRALAGCCTCFECQQEMEATVGR
jgi:RNA polymerase-binding transcription factor DksA